MFNPTLATQFRQGNRPDNTLLEPCWRELCPGSGNSALKTLFDAMAAAMTAEGSTDPAVVTIAVMASNLATESNLDKYVGKW